MVDRTELLSQPVCPRAQQLRRRISPTGCANADADSGLRNPSIPGASSPTKTSAPEELFNAARLVVAAEIAKIHTTEWTTQLLYDEPLYKGMNANWNGLLGTGDPDDSQGLSDIVVHAFGTRTTRRKEPSGIPSLPPALASSGLGSTVSGYDITNPNHVNGGVNHFGSPFNFPEEFVTVYRLHPLVPDLIEYRDAEAKTPTRLSRRSR